jgi:hypothetical protein
MPRTAPVPAVVDLVPLAEGAKIARRCTRTMRRYIAAGLITGYRVGPRDILVDRAELTEKLIRPMAAAGR